MSNEATDAGRAVRELHEKLADAIEARSNDPRIRAVRREFLSGIDAVTRELAQLANVAHATGVDTSKVFVARARELAQGVENVSFEEGDGRRTPFDDESFDVVVLHTVICHALVPEQLIAEAFRVLRSGGLVAILDADDATVAIGDSDPLQACIDVLPVQNLGLVRRVPAMLEEYGFEALPMRCHGYVEAPEGGLMLAWIDRGAEALVKLDRIGKELADALRAEAQRRSASKSWFGHISFFSAVGRKP
jgi:SAM-dependent methyltransferase